MNISLILLFIILVLILSFIVCEFTVYEFTKVIKGGKKLNTVNVNKKKLNTINVNKKRLNTVNVNNSRHYNYTHVLENISDKIICNWSILKNKPPKDNYNVISVVFFLRKHLTGKGNEVNKYVDGIKNIIKTFNLIDKFILRIYFDISVKNILHNIFDHTSDEIFNNVELYQYDIPILKDGNNHHRGLLGMIIRFFPLFDIPLHKVDRCLILDIDNDINSYFNDIINTCDNKNINFCHRFLYGYMFTEHASIYINFSQKTSLEKYLLKYSIICSFIYQNNINFPYVSKLLLSNFLNLFITSNAEPSSTNDLFNKLKKINLINFEYGFDEIFINKIYFEHIFNEPKIHISATHNINKYLTKIIRKYINFVKYIDKNIKNLKTLILFIKKLAKIYDIHLELNTNNNNLEQLCKYLIYYIYTDKNFIFFTDKIYNIDHVNLNTINNFLDSEIKYYSNSDLFLVLLNSIKSLLNFNKNNHIFIIDIKKTNNNFIEDKYIYIHT